MLAFVSWIRRLRHENFSFSFPYISLTPLDKLAPKPRRKGQRECMPVSEDDDSFGSSLTF